MAEIKFDISIESNVKVCKEDFNGIMDKVLTMWGMQAESAAKERCPVDTGLLRNSITWAVAGSGVNSPSYRDDSGTQTGSYQGQAQADVGGARHVYIGSNVKYAEIQELGSFNHHAGQESPFLRPGIEDNLDYFREILETEMKNGL